MGHHSKAYSVVIKNNCVCLYLVTWEKCAMSWPSEKTRYRTAACGKYSLRKKSVRLYTKVDEVVILA